jgi:glutathione S-transferase
MGMNLYIVHGSHPCAAVEKALTMKGLEYRVIEWPPPMHAPIQRVIFGARTVPGLTIDGEKVIGSRAIMRRLDQLAPEPPLLPADPQRRRAVEEAERWGDEVFQPIARRLVWAAMRGQPDAMVSYSEGSRIPLPPAAIRASAPVISRLGCRLNRTNGEVARTELAALPGHLDHIDELIEQGTIGDPANPNAADLQIASTVRLMLTIGDARALIEGRPCRALATALFPDAPGDMPVGALATAP